MPPKTPRESELQSRPLRYSFWGGVLSLGGSVAPRVFPDVCLFGVIAAVVVVVEHAAERWYEIELSVPVGPFEAAGAVLGLLLVLRTNAGYERWWEARKLWGGIVNQSRNLAVAGLAYGPDDRAWREGFVRWAAAFPHVIRCSLRETRELPEVARLLGAEEARRTAEADHMPDAVALTIARLLAEARRAGMEPLGFLEAERQRGLLVDHLGGCERILKTPLARVSAIEVRRFIALFVLTLPFALLHDFDAAGPQVPALTRTLGSLDWIVVPFVMLTSYALLGLERIGMELQNPFDVRRLSHLPLNEICNTIERNLLELLAADAGRPIPTRAPAPSAANPHPEELE